MFTIASIPGIGVIIRIDFMIDWLIDFSNNIHIIHIFDILIKLITIQNNVKISLSIMSF